ncbi:MAG: hypothetical protein DMG88_05330 [Acidobacteria bacterium]|nr:MAG: hypothetical protein DMG88_05330 [Acidobacteriota bacterium]
MNIPLFALVKLYPSDWYLLVIVVPLCLAGIWLLYGELLKWSKQRVELYGARPARILDVPTKEADVPTKKAA